MSKPSIFGIGLSRTGTTSLNKALAILGYDACHWPCSMAELERHEAVTDITVTCRFEDLDRKYPGSKFIYTIRDLDPWLRSCEKHWARLKTLRGTGKIPPFAEDAEIKLYGTLAFSREQLTASYKRHDSIVMSYFEGRERDLLTLDITSGEGWEDLCAFLGKPIPKVPFPNIK